MSYTFYLTNTTSRQLLSLTDSKLNNEYIDYTAKGGPSGATVRAPHAWSTNLNPVEITGGYSAPLKLFHSTSNRFLGSSEQVQPITNGNGETGEVAGTVLYTCADSALKFVFKSYNGSATVFQILLYESEIMLDNKKSLCYDRLNSNRVMITKFAINTPTASLDNLWQYSAA